MRLIVLAATFLAFALSGAARASAGCGNGRVDTDRIVFQVTLSDGNTYPVVGFLYHHGQGNRVLQVTVHGVSDDHRYWAIPDFDGVSYSYARFMVCRGYAVLALDTIGTGESGKPDGDFLNTNETVSALRQVLEQVRQGGAGHFKHLALVGHSFGAEQSALEQAKYNLADSVVITGWGHTPTALPPVSLPDLSTPYLPVGSFDVEKTAGFFYFLPQTAPGMVEFNIAAFSGTVSRGQFLDVLEFFTNRSLDMSTAVRSPVLLQFADQDVLYPAASEAPNEKMFWTSSPRVDVQVLPNIGHALNAHLTHLESWKGIDEFLRSLRHGHGA